MKTISIEYQNSKYNYQNIIKLPESTDITHHQTQCSVAIRQQFHENNAHGQLFG